MNTEVNTLKYKCFKDLQNSNWFVGHIDTIDGWRRLAIEWATLDGIEEVINQVNNLTDKDIIDFISEVWQLKIIPNRCYHYKNCECDNEPMYELETTDGEIIYVCEKCDEMWANCCECGKSDILGEGLSVYGTEYLCDKCAKERKEKLLTYAAKCYTRERDNGFLDFTIHDALRCSLDILDWESYPITYEYQGGYDKLEYEELVFVLEDRLGVVS